MTALHVSAGTAAENGTTTHTLTWSTDGSNPFTPATGSLLVLVVFGAVTNTASGSWTEQLQPVSGGELSVFTSTNNSSTAPPSSITITNNASNYGEAWIVYEFAAGSTYVSGVSDSSITPQSGAGTALTGLTGTKTIISARGITHVFNASATASAAWTAPMVEDTEQWAFKATNDGAYMTSARVTGYTSASITPAVTFTLSSGFASDAQSVTFAINEGATTLTKDVVERYRVLNALTKDVAEQYRVLNSLTKDTQERYRVLNALTKNTAESYRVYQALTRDVVESYRVLNSFTKDAAESYRVLNALTTEKVESYRVLNALTKNVTEVYRVLNAGTTDQADTWRVFNALSKDITETYTVLGSSTQVKDVTDSWRVFNGLSKDVGESYRILNTAHVDVVEMYRVLNALQVNRSDSWRVYQALTKDIIERYRVLSDTLPPPLLADVVASLESRVSANLTPERVQARL